MRDPAGVRVGTPTSRPPPSRLRHLVGASARWGNTPNRSRSPPSACATARTGRTQDGNVIGVSPGQRIPRGSARGDGDRFLGTAELSENLRSRDSHSTRPTSAPRRALSDRTHQSQPRVDQLTDGFYGRWRRWCPRPTKDPSSSPWIWCHTMQGKGRRRHKWRQVNRRQVRHRPAAVGGW